MNAGRLSGFVGPLVAVLVTGVLAAVSLWVGGYNPFEVFAALWDGAFGTPQRILSFTLPRSVPLILTGLAVAIAFRVGVWNIGAEGQLYVGAIAAVWVGLNMEAFGAWIALPVVLGAGCAAGLAWAAVPGLMKHRLGVGEVITTILMNFIGIHLASYVMQGPLREPRGVFPRTEPIAESARLPVLVPQTALHAGFLIAVGLCVATWIFFRFTAVGFRWRAVGESPRAADLSGRIDPSKAMLGAFLLSGLIAGLAGAAELSGRSFQLQEGFSPEWGYTAIAVALLAGLNPLAVIVTGLFFGALEAGAGEAQRAAGVPMAWVNALEAIVILVALAVEGPLRKIRDRASKREPADA